MNISKNIFIITSLLVSGNRGDVIGLIADLLGLPCQPKTVNLSTILPAATIDYSSLTVSGLSSGAIMSMQYHFAHSAEVKGAGLFAGIPYGTFYGSFLPIPSSALRSITGPNIIGPLPVVPIPLVTTDNSVLEANAESFAKSGLIDDTINLKGSRVYVFHGTVDPIVNHEYGDRLVEMYKHYGANLMTNLTMAATHTVPTDNFPTSHYDCSVFNILSDGINNCRYEGVFDMFSHLYGNDYKAPESSTVPHTGSFSAFFQGPYTASGDAVTDFMDSKGFLYVPKYCQDPRHTCKIHIAFHGCFQAIYNDLLCNNFALKQGYLQVADANNVVFLFPQAALLEIDLELRTNFACWDFFGGVSNTAWFKTGPQIASVRKMSRAVAKLPSA